MRDLVFLLLVAGFFAVAAAYVRACAAVVGPEVQAAQADAATGAAEAPA